MTRPDIEKKLLKFESKLSRKRTKDEKGREGLSESEEVAEKKFSSTMFFNNLNFYTETRGVP